MIKAIINGKLITPQQMLAGRRILIEDGIITHVQADSMPDHTPPEYVIDADGAWVVPGFIDSHIHGSNLADTMDASHHALDTMGAFQANHGVTSYLPTTGTASGQRIQAVLENFSTYSQETPGATPLGLHLEGPYLNVARKGAQPAKYLRAPNRDEYTGWIDSGLVKLITLAPELAGSLQMIEYGIAHGVEFAAGHSSASYEQLLAAADKGLRQATHLFNGMEPLHHRRPGVVGAVLSDERIYAQVIADGIHLHPAIVKLVVHSKGAERTILITDAMRAAGLADGKYELLGQSVSIKDGACYIANGHLAGSTLTMEQAVRNAIAFSGITLQQAVTMASYTPARALGLEAHKGQLTSGADADITLLDRNLEVIKTIVGGNLVYARE